MAVFVIISIDENVIYIYNNKDIKLLSRNLIDISLEAYWCICQFKKHYLVFKAAISNLEFCHLFVFFTDFYLIIYTSKV